MQNGRSDKQHDKVDEGKHSMGRIIRSTLSIDDRYLLTYTRRVKEIYVLELENFNIRRSSAIEYDCHFLFVRYSRDTWNT